MLIDDQQRMDLHFITGRVLSHGAGSHGDLPTGAGAHHGGVSAGTRAGWVQPVTILQVHPHGNNAKRLGRLLISYAPENITKYM